MIELAHVCKRYPTRAGMVDVLKDVNLTVGRGEKLGILGRNGAGKSTMIRILSGAEQPSSGTIHRQMRVSWPLAFGGAFQGALTGLDNLRFICRIYGINPEDKIDYVQDFAELGRYFKEPVRTYSAGMQARLAFAISMVVEFDCFLIDEVISVGDARFHAKCQIELFEKRKDRALVIVSHEAHNIREHCESVVILDKGYLHAFNNIDDGFFYYDEMMKF
jgi:capsular polysaccharide transport system ATP-binding protein